MLSPEEKTFLHDAEYDPGLLRERVRYLRKRGHTIREIAKEIDRSPSTVGYWSQSALIGVVIPPKSVAKIRRRYVEPHPEITEHLKKIAPAARRANKHSEYWSTDARKSRELNMILHMLYYDRLVPMTTLAHICGVSTAAISQRLKAYLRVGD